MGAAGGDYDAALWMELWAQALRDPQLAETRAELDGRWRRTIAEVVSYGQERGEFGPADPERFAVLMGSLLDGLSVQVALRDAEVTPSRVRELAVTLAERELGARCRTPWRRRHESASGGGFEVREYDEQRLMRALERRIGRRDLLQNGAAMALIAGLAGCGVGNASSGSKEDTEKPIAKKVDGDLLYFNYSEYIDPALVKGFEKKYGVQVRESYFDSMSAMTAKLRAGIAYDLIFPSGEYVQRLISGNLLRRIDRDKIKNIDTVYDYFANPWYDKDSEHSTPYGMYATGLGYRADKVTGMTGSWRDLGDVDSDDKSFLLDDYQECIGMANLVNGYPLNEVDEAKLEKSLDYLVNLKPKLRGISTDTITNMTSGNA